MDIAELRKEEDDLVNNMSNMSDEEMLEEYRIVKRKSETDRPEGIFYGRLVILIDMELQERGYRQYLIWKKPEEKKLNCLGCGNEYNKDQLIEYSDGHAYCADCITDDECDVDADGCLVNNDGDAETDME